MNHSSNLAAKVAARNKVNAEIRQSVPILLAAMRPFVGQKIEKVDGSFTRKFKDAMPQVGYVWYLSIYNVIRTFRADAEGPRHTNYQESQVYLGKTSDGILEELYDFNDADYRIDFTEAEVYEQRRAVKVARDAMQAWQSKLFYFGEHDN